MAKVLRMSFKTEAGRTVSISLNDPVDPLDPSAVEDAMDKVIDGDIFSSSSGDITTKYKAETIETTVESVLDFT